MKNVTKSITVSVQALKNEYKQVFEAFTRIFNGFKSLHTALWLNSVVTCMFNYKPNVEITFGL